MKSIVKSIFRRSFVMMLGALLFASAAFAGTKDNKEIKGRMNVDVVTATGANNYNLLVHKGTAMNELYVTVYDSNNTKLFSEKINSKKSLKRKYKLSKYHSKSFFFVVESGDTIYTQEVM